MKKQENKWIKIILGIVLASMLVGVFNLGINIFYPEPEYSDYCYTNFVPYPIEEEKKICPAVCVPVWELKEKSCVFNECGSGCGPDGRKTFSNEEQCRTAIEGITKNKRCDELYQDALKEYQKITFFIGTTLGVILLIIGLFLIANLPFQIMMIAGGSFLIIQSFIIKTAYNNRLSIFIFSLIILLILSYFVWKKFKNK